MSGTLIEGENLEVDPPRRLVQTMVALWSDEAKDEGPTRVTWEIEPVGDSCRLTVTHDQLREDASVMLAVEPYFAGFIAPQDITDTSASRKVIVGMSAESREQVDERVSKAIAAGGQSLGDAQDDGFMYMRGFLDLDGHQWSFLYMDMAATSQLEG